MTERTSEIAMPDGAGEAFTPAMLRQARFETVRKGYRPEEVTALLEAAADALDAARRDGDALRAEVEAARSASAVDPTELGRLRDEVARLRDQLERQRGDAEGRVEGLRGELLKARAERDEALAAPRGGGEADLMSQVGDHVGQVLRQAEQAALTLRTEAEDESRQRLQSATIDAERVRREAEQRALLIRREAQEDADAVGAE
ncbi:MAG: DivIVA domain-containing protein, partial [Actinomycetota bacterium]